MNSQHLTRPQVDLVLKACKALEAEYQIDSKGMVTTSPASTGESLRQAETLLKEELYRLSDESVIEMQALMWQGRDGGDFSDNLDYSKSRFDPSTRGYMVGKGQLLRDYIEKGIEKSGVKFA